MPGGDTRTVVACSPYPLYIDRATGQGSLWTLHFTAAEVIDYRSKATADPAVQRRFHLALLAEGVFSAPRGMFALSTVMSECHVDDALDRVSRALSAL